MATGGGIAAGEDIAIGEGTAARPDMAAGAAGGADLEFDANDGDRAADEGGARGVGNGGAGECESAAGESNGDAGELEGAPGESNRDAGELEGAPSEFNDSLAAIVFAGVTGSGATLRVSARGKTNSPAIAAAASVPKTAGRHHNGNCRRAGAPSALGCRSAVTREA
jgi:hypothetical protein